jgi:PAS domain S-box-containing protein
MARSTQGPPKLEVAPGRAVLAQVAPDEPERPGPSPRYYSWFTVAVAAAVAHLLVSLTLSEPALNIASAIVNFLCLVLVAGLTTRNAVRSKQAIRLFWTLLAIAYWLWALPPCVWFYFAVLHAAVPNFLLMTFPWYLHIVLMIAAMAARPHLRLPSQKPYEVTLNFLIVLFLLVFAYAYLLFPYRFASGFPVVMRRWAAMFSVENLILLMVLGTLVIRSQPPWRTIYLHLLGASALYAVEAEFAHMAFASRGRFTDGLVAVLFTVSTAWFVWISLLGRERAFDLSQTVQLDTSDRKHTSVLAMMAVVTIPLVGVFELLHPNEPHNPRWIRLLVVLISIVFLAIVAFIQDNLSNRELASDVSLANDRLRLALESENSVVWDWDVSGGQDFWLGDLQTMFGIQSTTSLGQIEDFRRYVHPKDREQVSKAIRNAVETHTPYAGEFRMLWPDGTVRFAAATAKCCYSSNGLPQRMLGITIDISERKRAERELRELSGRLIAAQEEERSRIARELHDDLSQRLALLAIEIQALYNSSTANEPAGESLASVRHRVNQISEDIHSLSHRLHPAILDRVGLVPALRSLCRELQTQSGIKLAFTCRNVPDAIPKHISVCLFRIVQEAVGNVVKHSAAEEADIELTGNGGHIRLRVVDLGLGFEQDSDHRTGLGLVSMRERVRLVGGELSVRSQVSEGTVVQADIPLPCATSSENPLEATA